MKDPASVIPGSLWRGRYRDIICVISEHVDDPALIDIIQYVDVDGHYILFHRGITKIFVTKHYERLDT